jgi:hypothetical protein
MLDNLSIHTAKVGKLLVLVYTPPYDPDANRIE